MARMRTSYMPGVSPRTRYLPPASATSLRMAPVSRLRTSTCAPCGTLASLPVTLPCRVMVVAWAASEVAAPARSSTSARGQPAKEGHRDRRRSMEHLPALTPLAYKLGIQVRYLLVHHPKEGFRL